MERDEGRMASGRRDFLKLAGLGGVAAGAAALASAAPEEVEAAPTERQDGRYRETDHVRRFYETARF